MCARDLFKSPLLCVNLNLDPPALWQLKLSVHYYAGSRKLSLPSVQYGHIYSHMKTTIELPDAILERTKVAAARRRTSMKNLVIQGLEMLLQNEVAPAAPADALARLREGYHLGGHPMTREEIHAR